MAKIEKIGEKVVTRLESVLRASASANVRISGGASDVLNALAPNSFCHHLHTICFESSLGHNEGRRHTSRRAMNEMEFQGCTIRWLAS